MLIMTYTAGSFILAFFLMTSVLALERNETDDFGNVTPSIPIGSTLENITNTTMMTVTNATLSETNISQTFSSITQVPIATEKLPDDEVNPTPPVYPPIPTLRKPTTSTTFFKDIVMTTPNEASKGSDGVGYIILVIIIVMALLAGLGCYVARSRGRRYSVDLTSRPDEVQMPLNTVEPEGPVETVTSNAETKKAAESTGCAADHNPEERKEDVPEKSPSAPVEPSTEGKPEDEGAEENDSHKNSMDPLKESNDSKCDSREGEAVREISQDNV